MEKALESRLNIIATRNDWWCIKLWPVSFTGLPDRMILIPGGRMVFCELKSEGKKPNKRQEWVHKTLRELGFKVYVIDTKDKLKQMLDEIRTL